MPLFRNSLNDLLYLLDKTLCRFKYWDIVSWHNHSGVLCYVIGCLLSMVLNDNFRSHEGIPSRR